MSEHPLFHHIMTSVNESNVFIVGCQATRDALLVDAGANEDAIQDFLEKHGLTLRAIFVTHDHYDHTDGLGELVDRYHPAVYAGASTAGGCPATVVQHGDDVRVGALTGQVLDTHGHTPHGLSLHLAGMVFTGDALFAGSVGGTRSPEDADTQRRLIREHIFSLPPETEVHVGHGPSSTVAVESRFNPFFV
jgi:glyoxylase-like metal-dependent hydrolase (beta-lactamase superfamily II)